MEGWHPSAVTLAEYIGGDCEPDVFEEVTQHLSSCEECRTLVEKRFAEIRRPAEEAEILLLLDELGIRFGR